MAKASEAGSVRREVEGWLDQWWDPDRPLVEWRGVLADSGWGCPTWPTEWYGKGFSPELAAVVSEAFALVGAVGPAAGAGMALAAPTILEHGSADVKGRLLRPMVTGEDKWCQLFSEPGSGSDLAGITTRADRDGDEWLVNGQKVWTTGAHQAAYGMLLARTNWDVPKHRGITYFALPMDQPGVEVRPLRQMNGKASFNEVFLTDVRARTTDVIGDVDDGWSVASTTLAFERATAAHPRLEVPRGWRGRPGREAAEEIVEYAETYDW